MIEEHVGDPAMLPISKFCRLMKAREVPAQRNPRPLTQQSFLEPGENHHTAWGTPDGELERIKHLHGRICIERPVMYSPVCRVPGEVMLASVGVFGKAVPATIKDWWEARVDAESLIPIFLQQWGVSRYTGGTGRVFPNRWRCLGKQSSDM